MVKSSTQTKHSLVFSQQQNHAHAEAFSLGVVAGAGFQTKLTEKIDNVYFCFFFKSSIYLQRGSNGYFKENYSFQDSRAGNFFQRLECLTFPKGLGPIGYSYRNI